MPNRRGFSITRLEGSRCRLRRTRSVYGESTKEGPERALSKGVKPVENFNIFRKGVASHEVLILPPSKADLEDVFLVPRVASAAQRLRSSRYIGLMKTRICSLAHIYEIAVTRASEIA